MKALSLQTGDSVSAVYECQDVASCPFRPSKGRKSRALPHPGPLALQPLRSGCKASTNLMAKNYTNIKRGLTHREIPVYVLSRDYAGKGVANQVSMVGAMKLAVGMAERQEYSFA